MPNAAELRSTYYDRGEFDNETLLNWSRHLLPVIQDGVVLCEGSPTRAQFLERQPRDTRAGSPRLDYTEELEEPVRAAYQRMQIWASQPTEGKSVFEYTLP